MKLRLLYHSPKGEFKLWPPRLVGSGIVAWTWALALVRFDFKSLKHHWSHVELWEPDEDGNFTHAEYPPKKVDWWQFVGFCHSSTTRGKYKGVRIAPASEVLKHPERWAYLEFEAPDKAWKGKDGMRIYIEKLVKKITKYDFLGLFGFFFPINIHSKKKYYCSELIHYILWRLCVTEKKHKRISPRRSAKVMTELFGPLKQL